MIICCANSKLIKLKYEFRKWCLERNFNITEVYSEYRSSYVYKDDSIQIAWESFLCGYVISDKI